MIFYLGALSDSVLLPDSGPSAESMSDYRYYGSPTAPHHPARAQNARLTANGQTYNVRIFVLCSMSLYLILLAVSWSSSTHRVVASVLQSPLSEDGAYAARRHNVDARHARAPCYPVGDLLRWRVLRGRTTGIVCLFELRETMYR